MPMKIERTMCQVIRSTRESVLYVEGKGGNFRVDLWPGTVLLEPVGGGGFGYDPIFKPAGYSVSAAELTPDEKNAVSHRGLAFAALMPVVREKLLR